MAPQDQRAAPFAEATHRQPLESNARERRPTGVGIGPVKDDSISGLFIEPQLIGGRTTNGSGQHQQ